MATTQVTIDCEGPCCCRCTWCKGIGYWSSYDITFPVSDGEVRCILGVRTFVPAATDVIQACISGNTFTVTPNAPFPFGSAGGNGDCSWQTPICPNGLGGFSGTLFFSILDSGVGALQVPYVGACVPGPYYPVISFDCRTGGTISGDPTVNCISACANNPHFPSNITITPTVGATWQQCGLNSDGTTVTDVPPPMLVHQFSASASSSKIELPAIPHPDRCDSYLGRDEFRPGCNGWLCAGKCAKGIKAAMPGLFCQTCESYDVDLDFIGQGPEGWFK